MPATLSCFRQYSTVIPASWWSNNTFVYGAGDLRFKPRTGQIGNRVANNLLHLRRFSEMLPGLKRRENGPCKLVTSFGVIRWYTEKFDLILNTSMSTVQILQHKILNNKLTKYYTCK